MSSDNKIKIELEIEDFDEFIPDNKPNNEKDLFVHIDGYRSRSFREGEDNLSEGQIIVTVTIGGGEDPEEMELKFNDVNGLRILRDILEECVGDDFRSENPSACKWHGKILFELPDDCTECGDQIVGLYSPKQVRQLHEALTCFIGS